MGVEPGRPHAHPAPAPGVTWSDGTPFTSADVLFTLQAIYDTKVESVVASSVMAGGQADSGDRARRVDRRPDLRRSHRDSGVAAARHVPDPAEAQARRRAESRNLASRPGTPRPLPSDIVGHRSVRAARVQAGRAPRLRSQPDATGARRQDGQKLPYLDRLVLQFIPEQNAELLRAAVWCDRSDAERAAP